MAYKNYSPFEMNFDRTLVKIKKKSVPNTIFCRLLVKLFLQAL